MRVESRAFDRWWAGHAYLLVVGMVGGWSGWTGLPWCRLVWCVCIMQRDVETIGGRGALCGVGLR